ncbi:MAG: magnesium transporter [candidate division KSB1 bacterium]|nr:magnesium transporter [candidate division KSB1 bacterium]
MKNEFLVPELRELLNIGDIESLRDFCESNHPAEVADFISALEPNEIWQILLAVKPEIRAEIFSHFDEDDQLELTEKLSRTELANLITDMSHDDRVDLFKRLPEETQRSLLPALAQAEREDIRRLASYEEGTAGSVMTSEYAVLQPSLTAAEAIEKLRLEAPNKETIYYAYVVDDQRRLIGFISLKDLIIARPHQKVEDLMHRDVIYVKADDDQEEAARKIQKYDLLAIPVVNNDRVLVGIITHDDALDIITQEHTEDMEKIMAIGGSHEAGVYLRTSAWEHFKNRATWVVSLAALGLVSGMIIHSFESTLMNLMILALYMPMVADTGGNTGSQSATVVVRALALKEISPSDFLKVIFKELRVSLLLAVILGLLSWLKVMFLSQGSTIPSGYTLPRIGLAIAVALGLQVVTATLIGAVLPLIAAKLKLDPAVIASPALTTIVDMTGLVIYFTSAKLILGI